MILLIPIIGFSVAYLIGSVVIELFSIGLEDFSKNKSEKNDDDGEKKVLAIVFVILFIVACVVVNSIK